MGKKKTIDDPVVIVAAKRTPLGNFNGYFKDTSCIELGKTSIASCLSQASLQPEGIDEVIMGCVLPANLGQAPARQAALAAGLLAATPATTINKMCGSGMKAIMLGHDTLLSYSADVVVAGGMENMSRAPYLLPKARFGYRLGHGEIIDHMIRDGLEDAYQHRRSMGCLAEDCAQKYQLSREQQDQYALTSLIRSQQAMAEQRFQLEIAPVVVTSRGGDDLVFDQDQGPLTVKAEKIPLLPPAFVADGSITAANSSSIADGAASVILMRESDAQRRHCQPLARIIGHVSYAAEPGWFTTAPIGAIEKLLDQVHWSQDEVDLFEINEAFAVVVMAAINTLSLDHQKVNVSGGACVLGHPIGASGARILVTLIYALQQRHLKHGIAALCIGGGEAVAVAIECCS